MIDTFSRCAFAIVLLVATVLSASAQTVDPLFFIQRSKNINEVHYDANVAPDGALDPTSPIEGYWLNKASDGSRSPIRASQRLAYGYSVEKASQTMKLRAFPSRPLKLVRVDGKWRARMTVNGRLGYLTRLYVTSDDSGLIPKVLYVDIFGEDVGSGAALQERVNH